MERRKPSIPFSHGSDRTGAAALNVTVGPPGLDLKRLSDFLEPNVSGLEGRLEAEVIEGGRSNLTYVVHDRARRWVLRRPPLAHVLPTAHDMKREWRIINALGPTGTPVPRGVAFCEDTSVIGAPFYLMEYLEGRVVRGRLPAGWPAEPDTGEAISAALVDALVRLHSVVPDDIGLADFGHPEGFLERQVERWWRQWEASKTRVLPAIDELRRRLESSVPAQGPSGIVHGDYRLDNVIFAPDDPGRIAAIVDWEMSTLGDPLCDLGLLLVYWVDNPDDPTAHGLAAAGATLQPGFYTRDRVIQEYTKRTDRDLSSLDWYVALGGYKLAIIAEGIHARFLMGATVGEGFERVGQMVPVLVEHALEALGG
jgi:aminoglycoside phosphotransferase (APT) family kinase protein